MQSLLKTLPCLIFLLASSLLAKGQAPIVPGHVIAMLQPNASVDEVAADLEQVKGVRTAVRVERELSAPMRAWLFTFDPDALPQEAMLRAFRAHKGVQLAQNNHVIEERATTPNDPQFDAQWWHQNIQSELAWDITTGGVTATGDTIVVAIIEKADLEHPDLAANAWMNHAEIPGNGIDDDGNGYVDDVLGWNPQSNDDNVYNGSHGTQVAGMIGAVGNNDNQVVGVNWNVKMMPVHYRNTQEANVLESYTYPLVMRRLYNSSGGARGAFVVATNASWGVDGGQPADAPIWCALYDTLGTAGILNCGSTTNSNVDVDLVGDLPTACPSDYMISVTATNSNDMRTFSGYGATTVDLGAPGAGVLTTAIGGGTNSPNGTSFASPLTAGVIALMYSVPCPSLAALAHNDPEEVALRVRQALFNGVEQVGNLPGNTVTGGRVNVYNSVQLLMDECEACPSPYNLAASSDAIGSATISWNAMPGTYALRYREQGTSSWTELLDLDTLAITLDGLATCTPYEFQMAAYCEGELGEYGPTTVWVSEGCCTPPLSLAAQAIDTTSGMITWSTVLAAEEYGLRWREEGTGEWQYFQGPLEGNSTTLTGFTPCSDIEVQMGSLCEVQDSDWSASTILHVPGCGQCIEGDFCTSKGDDTFYEWIALVSLADIHRQSGSDGGYADVDVTGQSTTLLIGESYPIQLAPGYNFFAYEESFTVWMDFNRDGEFSADERLLRRFTSSSNIPLSDTITIPLTATPGPVRMRVLMKDSSHPSDGCTSYSYGETEDYCVTLVDNTVGVEQEALLRVQLFPQPANQLLRLSLPHAGTLRFVATDMTGRIVLERTVQGGEAIIATDHLGSGMYLFRLLDEGTSVASGRFMVMH